MKHLFVPYGISLMAKEKKFNEECYTYFLNQILQRLDGFGLMNEDFKDDEARISAPLYRQLIDWFEEKHNIFIEVRKLNDNKWCYQVHGPLNGDMIHVPGIEIKYEAYNEAFKEAFKLIK